MYYCYPEEQKEMHVEVRLTQKNDSEICILHYYRLLEYHICDRNKIFTLNQENLLFMRDENISIVFAM